MPRVLMSTIANLKDTVVRFYATCLFALFGSVVGIHVCNLSSGSSRKDFHANFIFACVLGIGLSISITLFAERNKYNERKKFISHLVGLGLLGLYYFSLPEKWQVSHFCIAWIFIISLHCLVSFAAFIKQGSEEGFWQFNRILFIHILTSLLYSSVLFAGISLAILAAKNLFSIAIDDNIYFQLWIFLAGIFNTYFFLSGIPKNFDELDTRTDYPRGLKIFTQFVLLPLVTVYFAILYLYMAKMIFLWQLPKGGVSLLILGFSIFGILALLLVYPLQNLAAEKWIKIYAHWFYRALLPLIILLFVSIGTRISSYGITESRYYILLIACWLAGISIYLQINRLHNIKIIPISLCLIGLLSFAGPWGAFSVSKRSQLKRFEGILEKNHLIKNGIIVRPVKEVSFEDKKDLVSLIEYLGDVHGQATLAEFVPKNQEQFFGHNIVLPLREEIKSYFGLQAFYSGPPASGFRLSSLSLTGAAYDIKGYDYLIERNPTYPAGYDNEGTDHVKIENDDLILSLDKKKLELTYKGEKFTVDFKVLYEKIKKSYKREKFSAINDEDLTVVFDGKYSKMKVVFRSLEGRDQVNGEGFIVYSLGYACMVKVKK
jgi:hypothetical protein